MKQQVRLLRGCVFVADPVRECSGSTHIGVARGAPLIEQSCSESGHHVRPRCCLLGNWMRSGRALAALKRGEGGRRGQATLGPFESQHLRLRYSWWMASALSIRPADVRSHGPAEVRIADLRSPEIRRDHGSLRTSRPARCITNHFSRSACRQCAASWSIHHPAIRNRVLGNIRCSCSFQARRVTSSRGQAAAVMRMLSSTTSSLKAA